MTDVDAATVAVVKRFVDAVAWGEHLVVWELLSASAREEVLDVAERRGMDSGRVSRLRLGEAPAAERDAYLSDLVNGLRSELSGCDLDEVSFRPVAALPGAGTVSVDTPAPPGLGDPLPVAMVDVVEEPTGWRVARLAALRST